MTEDLDGMNLSFSRGLTIISECKLIVRLALTLRSWKWTYHIDSIICTLDLYITPLLLLLRVRAWMVVLWCVYTGLPFVIILVSIMEQWSPSYGRISVFHLKDLHPATAVWEASPVSLVTFCTAFTTEQDSVCICATLFSVLKMVSLLDLQIRSKKHKKSLKTQKAPRKVRDILTECWMKLFDPSISENMFLENVCYSAPGKWKGTHFKCCLNKIQNINYIFYQIFPLCTVFVVFCASWLIKFLSLNVIFIL